MSIKLAREAIGAIQRILDPRFEEIPGGKRRFRDIRKSMLRDMVTQGPLRPDELEDASRRMPNMTEQQVQDFAYRKRGGIFFEPGAPENG